MTRYIKLFVFLIACMSLVFSMSKKAQAQQALSNNPWAQDVQQKQQQPAQPTTTVEGGLPANPWQGGNTTANNQQNQAPADTVNTPNNNSAGTNGGSYADKYGTPDYVGESTTWTKAQGQERIAPEVNVHNMLSMTDHLRKMGYEIPDSVDSAIRTAPAKIRNQIMGALNRIRSSEPGDNPFSYYTNKIISDVEDKSGLSTENILGNSMDIMSGQ
jgi:cbb3-type cytochrome oxidase subunit 3